MEHLTVVADAGYASGEQGELCQQARITAVVPRPRRGNTAGEAYFERSRFTYDTASDTYRCPAGQTLTLESVSRAQAKKSYANFKACQSCELKPKCTKGRYRRVHRSLHEEALDAMHQRAAADPAWMKKRSALAEHPFAIIKAMLGLPRLLLRGLAKAKAEWALIVLCYNLKRTIAILGVPQLLTRLRPVPA